ncbi:DUF1611 domain-containing protein [Chondromyces crocatus]|uniref:Glycogen branching enzyme2C GH-57-type2C archaeal n=1 Tax=Chondromyces crocatus TaxID=52 RepID=A0A0K1EH44_CHOCO|nr:DUF1611 domain-containing protein [Chondromyces crocatus]AKT39918.1 glycogen branching enzyme2C GH-57-type2C archaeal [Chondromyces crocatus]
MGDAALTLVLNTHMPWVLGRAPLFDQPESWLFEAITETYIPLFQMLSRWDPRRFPGKLVLSLTPCLARQLCDARERYLGYLRVLHAIARAEVERTASREEFNRFQKHPQQLSTEELRCLQHSASFYVQRIEDSLAFIAQHDFADVLRSLACIDGLELWTSSPHHNYLPFFSAKTADRFVARGVEEFSEIFGRHPDGFWLPECAFYPGIERSLVRHGVPRTALSLHAIGSYAPTSVSGIYRAGALDVLIHDFRIALHLWKAPSETLPAHPLYREFFRDLGFDVVPEYFDRLGIEIPAHRRGHCWTGIKYHAVSGAEVSLGDKRLYDPEAARAQARHHVPEFWDLLDRHRPWVHDHRTFVLAFDTELFGHWWHEGIPWLEGILDAAPEPATPVAETPSEPATLPMVPRLHYSTWGQDFYSEHWLTRDNCWMYALVKLVESQLDAHADPALFRSFERLSASDYLFMYPDPSQQASTRGLFLELFTATIEQMDMHASEVVTAFPVDPFKHLLVYVTRRVPEPTPSFHLHLALPEGSKATPRQVTLEPEHHSAAGYQIYFQYFPLRPRSRYELRIDGTEQRCTIDTPDFGIPLLIGTDLRPVPKYNHEKLYRKVAAIWEEDPSAPVRTRPSRRSHQVYTREALAPVLGGRSAAVFKYNKEGYALLRFRDLALATPTIVFDDGLAAQESAAYMGGDDTSIPVSASLEDIALRSFDAVILTCSLNFASETAYVRALLDEAVGRHIPVVSLYDDILHYDLLDMSVDTSAFHRIAIPEGEPATALRAEPYHVANLLGVFGTDTVQGKFTTQIYLREALRQHLRVKHLATEPTGLLLGADIAYSRILGIDLTQRLSVERGLMLGLSRTSDLVITGGQNAMLFAPPGYNRADNASTYIYETFLPPLIVLTVAIETEPAAVLETMAYLRDLAERHGVRCEVIGLAMMGGRKLHGGRWTETYFLGVREEILEAARRRLERATGLSIYAIPEETQHLARAVLGRL